MFNFLLNIPLSSLQLNVLILPNIGFFIFIELKTIDFSVTNELAIITQLLNYSSKPLYPNTDYK